MTPRELLVRWLARQLPSEAIAWLEKSSAQIRAAGKDADLYMAVSLAARKVGKADVTLSEADMRDAEAARPGWDPRGWSADQAARVALLLSFDHDPERLSRCLDQLCITADVSELAAFYRGLPLYPDPPRYLARATEGLRTNMKNVFEAIAHRNPYPSEQFPEAAWNQMVLKAVFVGLALWPIAGLDRRANPTLARMLRDYAHERWAARRPVSPELWRCVGPFAAGPLLEDLAHVLGQGTPPERAAAVLALRSATGPEARHLLDRHAAWCEAVVASGVDWRSVLEFT
jgi:hypothetical protein